MTRRLNRRKFVRNAAAVGGAVGLGGLCGAASPTAGEEPLRPVGQAKGIHPGRVVWVHDPKVVNWKGPGDGHWYEPGHIRQDCAEEMMRHAVCDLTGQPSPAKAWDLLFRHLNGARGKGGAAYRAGEKVVIKPNWVGMIWLLRQVDADSYTLKGLKDYMNTAPQLILALFRQLEGAGVRQADISICDTLAYIVNEYYDILHAEFPGVQYVDYGGKFGRVQVKPSSAALYWSCRPQGAQPDYVPSCFAEAEYVINFANLKAHASAGVTLCGKNHFGSVVRWPVQQGYYNMHRGSCSKQTKVYREQVDLMGHAHLGGKTVLYLIDGLLSGIHSVDSAPRKWASAPFNGNWTSSLLASQDPVAIDSVGLDFARAEWKTGVPNQPGADDYLHEAALADAPPSGTFYDPNHPEPVKRLASLGVHEHWNNAEDKKYSRNLGSGEGIELVAVKSD